MTLYMYFEVVLLRRLYAKCGRRSAQGIGELSIVGEMSIIRFPQFIMCVLI